MGSKKKKPAKVKTDIDDILGKPKKAKKAQSKPAAQDISDILGSVGRQMAATGMTFAPLVPPKEGQANKGGIWERRLAKGKNLGRSCMMCNGDLDYKGGRPRVICRKKECFRAYRNLYRKDYDARAEA